MGRREEEESKCREFVDELNRLAEHERYRYIGHVSELTGEDFPDCIIKDRRTSKELHVECTSYSADWTTVEKANVQTLERRFAYDLRDVGYENYDIFLQTRNPSEHPLQKLNRSSVEDLARSVKQFLTNQKPQAEQTHVQFDLDNFPRYRPLAATFQFLLLNKLANPAAATRLDDGSPVVHVGVIADTASERDHRLERAITSKLRGPGYKTEILLIYSEGPLLLFDAPQTLIHLKEFAEAHQAQQSYGAIWFLTHFWTADQKLYQVL